jgi:hypothetical protein
MTWELSVRVETRSKAAEMSSEAAVNETFSVTLRDAVLARRARGMAIAIYEVARLFGLSERRVRAATYDEIRSVLAWEYMRVQQRAQAELAERLRRSDAEAAQLRAKLADWGGNEVARLDRRGPDELRAMARRASDQVSEFLAVEAADGETQPRALLGDASDEV